MNTIWIGGFLVTVWLVGLTLYARRWWPLFYVGAVAFGFGTGLLIGSWLEWLRTAYWFAGFGFVAAAPFAKMYFWHKRRLLRGE